MTKKKDPVWEMAENIELYLKYRVYQLSFLLTGNKEYLEKIQEIIKEYKRKHKKHEYY